MAATEEALTEIPDVGGITARCIADYFRGDQAKDLIRRLKEAGVNHGEHRPAHPGTCWRD